MEIKTVDTFTWRPVVVSSYIEETIEVLEDPSHENTRVVSLLEEILTGVGEFGYYFSEEDGLIERYEEYRLGSQDVYNIVSIARTPHPEFNDYWYLAVSLNGCNLSSALTEYIRFQLGHGKVS